MSVNSQTSPLIQTAAGLSVDAAHSAAANMDVVFIIQWDSRKSPHHGHLLYISLV